MAENNMVFFYPYINGVIPLYTHFPKHQFLCKSSVFVVDSSEAELV